MPSALPTHATHWQEERKSNLKKGVNNVRRFSLRFLVHVMECDRGPELHDAQAKVRAEPVAQWNQHVALLSARAQCTRLAFSREQSTRGCKFAATKKPDAR